MRQSSRRMALCGVLCSLAVCLLLLGSVIPAATFCGPLLAMAALLPVLEELGPRAAGTAWAAVSILGLLLAADRELALVYLFFGWYPVLRPRINKLPSRPLRIAVKLAVCNGTVFLLYRLLGALLGLTEDMTSPLLAAATVVLANMTFFLADLALGRLTLLWRRKLRKRFFR